MKEFVIQIQEKEDGTIVKTWDYGTEDFENQLKEVIKEKMKERKMPWYLQLFVNTISDYIGEALSEAITHMIKRATEKPRVIEKPAG